MQYYKPRLEPLLAELERNMPGSDLAELRMIVDEIRARIARFDQRKE
jgi:hypothetical protein